MRCLLGIVAFSTAAAACGPITQPNVSAAPVNACGPGTALTCTGYPADASVGCSTTFSLCQVGTLAPFVLLVTVPVTNQSAATYAIAGEQLDPIPNAHLCATSHQGPCFELSQLVPAAGAYTVDQNQASAAGWYLGMQTVTLPVTATFYPLWTPPGSDTPTDARLLNLPLPPIVATAGCNTEFVPNGGLPSCPDEAFEWVATLPPADIAPFAPSSAARNYLAAVKVDAPFEEAYPDFIYPLDIPDTLEMPSENLVNALTLAQDKFVAETPPHSFSRADGLPFGPGWTAYYRDPSTNLAVSSHAALEGLAPAPRINYVVATTNTYLVVDGPAGWPELIDRSPAQDVSEVEVYPALPPSVHVSGTVVSPSNDPVSATLLFYSKQLDDVMSCTTGEEPLAGLLNYEARVVTQDLLSPHGQVGAFEVDLPQGYYDEVIIQPTDETTYAKTTNTTLPHVAVTPPVCSGASPMLNGLDIQASLPVSVSGTVVTADGRPMGSATVLFTPAAALAAQRFSSPVAEDQWPALAMATTADDGTFVAGVSPNGQYDLTVIPAGGTAFPWLVRPDHIYLPHAPDDGSATSDVASAVTSPAVTLEPLVVPPPAVLELTLHDYTDTPLTQAVVQAYAFAGGAAVEIGEALTDNNGHFMMTLSTQFATN